MMTIAVSKWFQLIYSFHEYLLVGNEPREAIAGGSWNMFSSFPETTQ